MNKIQIHNSFVRYGKNAKYYVRKCIGLLPVIYKEKIYLDEGFGSIFEYAAKLAGLSKEQVKRALSIDEKFEEAPVLQNLLRSGEVSMHKLARVASIVTEENQEEVANKVFSLTQKALETFVRDERQFVRAHKIELENNQESSQGVGERDLELVGKLSNELKMKLCELDEKGIDINELLMEFLQKREEEITQEKAKLVREVKSVKSRYVKVGIRRLLEKEYGKKCSVPRCSKDAKVIHHTRRFALSCRHDLRFLAPLCKEHHQIAHVVDVKFRQKMRV